MRSYSTPTTAQHVLGVLVVLFSINTQPIQNPALAAGPLVILSCSGYMRNGSLHFHSMHPCMVAHEYSVSQTSNNTACARQCCAVSSQLTSSSDMLWLGANWQPAAVTRTVKCSNVLKQGARSGAEAFAHSRITCSPESGVQ